MRAVWLHLCGRFYAVRALRARARAARWELGRPTTGTTPLRVRRALACAERFEAVSEGFFRRIGGV
jgi:hypothetical protein